MLPLNKINNHTLRQCIANSHSLSNYANLWDSYIVLAARRAVYLSVSATTVIISPGSCVLAAGGAAGCHQLPAPSLGSYVTQRRDLSSVTHWLSSVTHPLTWFICDAAAGSVLSYPPPHLVHM